MKTKLQIIAIILSLSMVLSGFYVSVFANNDIEIVTDFESNPTIELSEKGYDLCNMKLDKLPDKLRENFELSEKSNDKTPVAIDAIDADMMESFTTINDDGTKTLYLHATPIKYVDKETNEINFIDNTLIETMSKTKEKAYTNKSGDVNILLPAILNRGVSVEDDANTITMSPYTENNSRAHMVDFVFLGEEQTVMQYNDVFGQGAHLQYSAINNGLKENIFLTEYNGQNEFQFIIDAPGLIPDREDGPGFTFLDTKTGEESFGVTRPWARDSFEEEGEGNEIHLEHNNSYRVEQIDDGKYLLTMIINKDFLESESTVYPVLIDPTFTIGRTYIQDTVAASISGNWYPSQYLSVGKHSTSGETMSYIKITNIDNYKYINPNNIGRKDVLYYTKQTYNGGAYVVECWDSSTTVSVANGTWSNISNSAYRQLDTTQVGANGNYSFWIGDIFNEWLRNALNEGGFTQDYGFILKADQTNRPNKQFASCRNAAVDYQHLQVTYTEDTSLAAGTYYIRNIWQGKYFDSVMPEAGYTAGRTNAWEFYGGTNQQWKVTKNSDGTYGLSPVSRPGFYLEVYQQIDANTQPVTTYSHSPTVSAAKWRIIKNADGTYRIMPAFSNTRSLDVYVGTNTTMVFSGRSFPKRNGNDMQLYTYGAGNNQKFAFEASGGYRPMGASPNPGNNRPGAHTNFLGYVLFINQDLALYPVAANNIEDHLNNVVNVIKSKGVYCRKISSYTATIYQNEYRIAYRICDFRYNGGYHFIIQLSDGTWAGKNDYMASKHFGSGNPSTSPEMWDNNLFPTTNGTHYFAIRRS